MNYLAHCLLSGSNDATLAGNYIGDFVKGSDWELLPKELGQGVLLHRFIDSYTDDHIETQGIRDLVRPYCGRYAGVAADMIYDHCLARLWPEEELGDLEEFTLQCYERLTPFKAQMPGECREMFRFMSKGNWMYAYRELEGLERSLIGIERRIGRETGLVDVIQVVEREQYRFDLAFNRFFPEIRRACSKKLASFGT